MCCDFYSARVAVRDFCIHCIAFADAFLVHSRLHVVNNLNSAELANSVLYIVTCETWAIDYGTDYVKPTLTYVSLQ